MKTKLKSFPAKYPLVFIAVVLFAMLSIAAVPPFIRNVLTTNDVTLGSGLSISAGDVLSSTGGVGGPDTPQPLIVRGTNFWIDGGAGSSNLWVGTVNAGGLSNIFYTNMAIGQQIRAYVMVAVGSSSTLPQFQNASNYPSLFVEPLTSNTVNLIRAERTSTSVTNVQVFSAELELVAGSGVLFGTNNATRQLTITSSGGSGTPAGNSGAVQFNEGGAFAGTNSFLVNRTNPAVSIAYGLEYGPSLLGRINISNVVAGTPALLIAGTNNVSATGKFLQIDDTGIMSSTDGQISISFDTDSSSPPNNIAKNGIGFNFSHNGSGNVFITPNADESGDIGTPSLRIRTNNASYFNAKTAYHFSSSNAVDVGTFLTPGRTNYANDFVAKETIAATDATVNGRIGLTDTNGTTNAVITSDGLGRAGLGTNTPAATLHARTAGTNDLARFDSGVQGSVVSIRTNGITIGPTVPFLAVITNVLGTNISLDFPDTAAGMVSDLPVTISGVTSNNCSVILSIPWQSSSASGIYGHFESNDVVYIRFANNNLVTSVNPTPGTFSVLVFKQQ